MNCSLELVYHNVRWTPDPSVLRYYQRIFNTERSVILCQYPVVELVGMESIRTEWKRPYSSRYTARLHTANSLT
jgi:hypothetical protein